MHPLWIGAAAAAASPFLLPRLYRRVLLSRAKQPSLAGHGRIARRIAALLPFHEYGDDEFFRADGAPEEVAARRRAGFERLAGAARARAPRTAALSAEVEGVVSDVDFTNAYRVPFQFRNRVRRELSTGLFRDASDGPRLRDLDGNWSYDLTGSYGVNVFGYDFYKECVARGAERVRELGPVLGPYHPLVAENAARLRELSGLDEVSFHMSGTEAVMQAVRLAAFHTRRSKLVLFCGAYHGWWDGVQPGVGNRRRASDVLVLADRSPRSLAVLRSRRDVACVLVNPLQALHPNSGAPGDASLVASDRRAGFDKEAYAAWLRELRAVCTERGIPLVLDEVFLGFRVARGGAQEYFGVRADMVTWGKTLGGGLPVGVLCGRADLMKRYRDDRPTDVCFARGTFNSHPYVMGAMNELLRRLDEPELRASYARLDATWDGRAAGLNARLAERGLPVRVANLASVFTTLYERPARYNWMLQFYLRAEGLTLSWVGSGRFIFSHDYADADWEEVARRIVAAATAMEADGWWHAPAGLTNRAIKRRVLRELLAVALGRQPRGAGAASGSPSRSSQGAIGSSISPRST